MFKNPIRFDFFLLFWKKNREDGRVEDDRGDEDVDEDVEADIDVEEAAEVDGTTPSAGEPIALVLVFEIEAKIWGGNGGGTCWKWV